MDTAEGINHKELQAIKLAQVLQVLEETVIRNINRAWETLCGEYMEILVQGLCLCLHRGDLFLIHAWASEVPSEGLQPFLRRFVRQLQAQVQDLGGCCRQAMPWRPTRHTEC